VYKAGIKILEVKIGIESNREELLFQFPLKTEVKSLLTDFKDVESIPYSADLDGYISVEESMEDPSFEFSGEKARFRGPFLKLTREASDLRFSLWGNQGFLYRYALYLLERKHRIYNFHACALYQEKEELEAERPSIFSMAWLKGLNSFQQKPFTSGLKRMPYHGLWVHLLIT
jgi:hypothetical protein